jgi:hypothetical protein
VTTGGALKVRSGGGHTVPFTEQTSTKGLKAGVLTVLEAGTVISDASEDGVHSDGWMRLSGASVTVSAGDDAVHAETRLVVGGGTVRVDASTEGLEAAQIVVDGGDVKVVSSEDGVNAAGGEEQPGDYSLTVNGGTLVVDSGSDGFDSNGVAAVNGGTVVVNGPAGGRGTGALDVSGEMTVSGGVLLAAGSAHGGPAAGSPQGWVSVPIESVPAGSTLHLVDADGERLATYVTAKPVPHLFYSSKEIEKGAEYSVHLGGSSSGANIGGMTASGDLGDARRIGTAKAGQEPPRGR